MPPEQSSVDPCGLTARKVMRALERKSLCEHDLFVKLRPVDHVALHRLLPAMVDAGRIARYDKGTLPGPVVTYYCLPEDC